MNRQHIHFYWRFKVLLIFLVFCWGVGQPLRAQYYPIHATVQWPSPQSPYLSDYYSGSRDRLIVNLLNRDLQQPLLFARLRIRIKSTGFLATSREEINYPMLELSANVPTRLTNIDLSPYLQPQNLQINGRLHNGQLPTGYTEFSVQVVDYYTGRTLSAWHTGRSYLDVKKPPILNFPEKDARIGVTEPLYLRFQWMPRHQGLAGTEYEFVLKELPNNGAAPQSAFAYGNEIYRVRTRHTTLNYTHLDPVLFPNRCYAWQVQAIARDGVDEVGMFENGGYSEINWFYLTDDCQAPTGLRAHPRFAKVDLSWNKVIGTTGYVVECRPKTKLNTYEWSRTQIAGEHLTLAQLKLGWTYEWRVGTLCTDDHPVFSGVSEFTLSKQNDELLADCGKEPVRKDLSQEPNLRIKAGDIVTIGGDYPMTITEVVPLGDGWYSGRGKTRLKTIIDAPVALRFDRLRINVDNFQIDGMVEASYDEKKGKIANLDDVDDGGKDVKPATIRMREHKLDFTLPDIPQFIYNPKTGELETTDAEGNPQTIKVDVPENASYEGIFPMLVTDNKGNTYQISPSEQSTEGTPNGVENENKDEKIALHCERVNRVGDFNTESLSSKYGYIHFKPGEGKYAFDNGLETWYKKSVKVDRFYKPVAKGYIAPWKLVPVGENDVVTAKYEGSKNIDLKKVRFASEPNTAALPAKFNEAEQTWTISLRSVSPGASYDVFAVYEGVAIGKLRVVSYAKQQHKVTLVPINEVKLDKSAIEQQLNTIYNPVGVQFTVNVDERMRGNYDWETKTEKDSLLGIVGKSFWGYDKELKESQEMLNLQKTYQQEAGTLDGVYLFVLNGSKGLEGQNKDLLGEMPRKSRFGYIFTANSYNTTSLVRTIAHEVGHGIFTLQHTFDDEYGKGTKEMTNNLLDYNEGTALAAFQWNVMANPAVFTAMDKANDGKLGKKGSIWLTPDWTLFVYDNSNITGNNTTTKAPNGTIYSIKENGKFYDYITELKGFYHKGEQLQIREVDEQQIPASTIIHFINWTEEACGRVYNAMWSDVKQLISDLRHAKKKTINFKNSIFQKSDVVKCYGSEDGNKGHKENADSVQIHIVGRASKFESDILSEIGKKLSNHGNNILTNEQLKKDLSVIISIDGEDTQEVNSLKEKTKSYLHLIFTIKDNKVKFLRMETSDKFGDKLSHICELIKNEPLASQAIILYEVADLLDQGIEYLKIPESVWSCNNKSNVYKKVISYLLDTQFPVLIGNDFIGNKLNEESKFAFVCGLWDGTVDIVQSVPQLVKLLTCVLHEDCRESASSKWESFKNAVIEDESGHVLCHQDEYFCKAMQMISLALSELVADNCKVAYTVGSVVGPIAVVCIGDVAAGETVLTRLGSVGSGLKYAIKGLQLCDKVTDITRPLAKGLKVTTVLVKKAGKLLPEIRIEGKTILHYVGDKLHLRKFDAVTKKTIDEPIEESKLSQKIEDALSTEVKEIASAKFTKSLSSNKSFMDVLKGVRIKGEPIKPKDFTKVFEELHHAVPVNSVKSLDDVMNDFIYLIDNHLADFTKTRKGKQQITAFINELMQSTDKFKAGATTLEVIHNAQKYIPSKYYNTLSNLELEDLIAYADDAGDFRFDIKWEAKTNQNVAGRREVNIFVDTKNYSSARNMFKDLRQFKAYLDAIDNFDQLYIIQQGGRDVTKKDIIKQLEKAIANDAESVFRAKPQLWKNMDIDNFEELKRLCQEQKLSQGPEYEPFRNMILTTK
ncbi:hypothetical protein [Prevotella denticola]|uniref:hypothetical protein n=1 Tax=Prevotella denticola TaxID=28129 RepID=UPI00241D6610|nr:hypothetical protein [Prevotella denticola]